MTVPPASGSGPALGGRPIPEFSSAHPDAAEQHRAQAALDSPAPRSGAGVAVVYHEGDVRESGAAARLQQLGYAVREDAKVGRGQSTAITLGPDISPVHARLVALALMAGGIDVKRIRRSNDPALKGTISISKAIPLLDWPGLRVADLDRMAS